MKLSSVLSAGLLANGAFAAPAEEASAVQKRQSNNTKMTATNTLMWNSSLGTFLNKRSKRNPSYLNWSSDGCTVVSDYPRGWPFIRGCYRHDFGYRNYKNQGRFTRSNKLRIDVKFYNEYVSRVLSYHSSKEVLSKMPRPVFHFDR